MELWKFDPATRVTRVPPPTVWCERCDKAMAPNLYASGACCASPNGDLGMLNYKCPGCGKSVDVQHRHKL